MARSLQTRGVRDLTEVKRRAERQRSLERISRQDCDWIVDRVNELIAHIVEMDEEDDKEMEPF